MSKKAEQLYTLPVVYTEELVRETEEQISVATDLLEDVFDKKADNSNLKNMTPTIIEILWSNFSILSALNKELEDPTLHVNEQTQEEEYIFLEDIIYSLQNLLVTRHYANIRLNRLSYSVSLH